MRQRQFLPAAGLLALLFVALLVAGCGPSPATETGASPTTLPATPATATAAQATPPAIPAPQTATPAGPPADLLDAAREALAAYEPVADARPVVDAVLEGVAAWLDAGGTAAALPEVLGPMPVPGGNQAAAIQAWEVDLTGDGRQDTVLRIPVVGLPLFVFTSQPGPDRPAAHFLPADLESIQTDFPVEQSDWAAGRPAVEIEDVTGDGPPEVMFTTLGGGASSVQLFPRLYQWREGEFHLIFAATLVSWAGKSTMIMEPDPTAAGRSQIVLTYPRLYGQGFDHKMVNHPIARQMWRWSPEAGRFVPTEQSVDLSGGAWGPEMPPTVEDRLRWLTNEAEALFRSGDYEQAVTGYDAVLRLSADENWQPGEGEADWPALAAFRRAEALILAGNDATGLEAMAVVAELHAGDLLGELAGNFLEGYGHDNGPEAAARGVAAMQGVPLYDHFYYEEPGALRFPMDAAGILFPGAGLAAYLEAHPELAADAEGLEAGLVEAGYEVVEVALVDGTGEVQVMLASPPLPYQGEASPTAWLLAPGTDGWHVVQPGTGNGNGWPTVGSF
jgi:hypothetical protein